MTDRQRYLYEKILKKGYDNYFDYENTDEYKDLDLINELIIKGKLIIKELEYSTFIRPSKDDIIASTEYTEIEYRDYIENSKRKAISLYREKRNEYLKNIANEVVLDKKDILEKWSKQGFEKYKAYLDYKNIGSSTVYSLNRLGYKCINKKYSKVLIDIKYIGLIKENIEKGETDFSMVNPYKKMFDILIQLKNMNYITEQIKMSKGFKKKIVSLEEMGLVMHIYTDSKRLIVLTEQGFRLVRAGFERYSSYLKKVSASVFRDLNEEILSQSEQMVIRRLIANDILDVSILDENIYNKYKNNEIEEVEFCNKKYIVATSNMFKKYNLINERKKLFFNIVKLTSGIKVDDIEVDSINKTAVLNVFKLIYKGENKVPKSCGLEESYVRDIADVKKYSVVLSLVKCSVLGYVKFIEVGYKVYVLLTREGCEYFNIKPYEINEKKMFVEYMKKLNYKPLISEICDKGYILKSSLEKMYGKDTVLDLRGCLNEIYINDKLYVEASVSDNITTKKDLIKNNQKEACSVLDSTGNLIRLDAKNELSFILENIDVIDMLLLDVILRRRICEARVISEISNYRYKKYKMLGLVSNLANKKYIMLTDRYFDLIGREPYKPTDEIFQVTYTKERKAIAYFNQNEAATECLDILKKENVDDKKELEHNCKKILGRVTKSLNIKNKKMVLNEDDEKLILTIYINNIAVEKEFLEQGMLNKLWSLSIIKYAKGKKCISLSDKGNIIACDIVKRKNIDIRDKSFEYKLQYKKTNEQAIESNVLKNAKKPKKKKDNSSIEKGRLSGVELFKDNVRYKFGGIDEGNIQKHLEFLKTGEYVVFDCEFASEYGKGSNLIEVGAVKVRHGEIVDEMSCLIKTFKKKLIKYVVNLTGINKEMLSDGVKETEAIRRFRKFIGNCPVVAHEIKHDWQGGILYGCHCNGMPLLKNEIIDSVMIFKTLFPKERYGLDSLISKYDLKSEDIPRHRALGDSIYTFKALMKAIDFVYNEPIVIDRFEEMFEGVD